ncbi:MULTISPECIES: CheR family methyltransferase [Methylomonas]|uniref:CheR family methyltransferase n=1 Tax=Methylomonas TaxID=416 RepID=UPI001232287D|nr:protein-glutamate O-methyltransferase CheR [Methylomonas rhizoryzae]
MVTSNSHSHQNFNSVNLRQDEFLWVKDYLYKHAGIVLNDSKQALVSGRLDKRIRYYGFDNYSDYFRSLGKPGFENESFMMIDLLTTNETYFFREPKHFEFLKSVFFPTRSSGQPLRLWSAASSSGEEAYTLAMLVSEHCPYSNWEIIGTDISTRIIEKARRALYPICAAEKIPLPFLKKYCLKGSAEFDGFFLIEESLCKHVKFLYANLIDKLPDLGLFDVIFLRNVMIYFDVPTKQNLVDRIQNHLIPGGYFIVSHSESLSGMKTNLQQIAPSIYQKPA